LLLQALTFVFPFFFFSSRRRHTRSKRDWSSTCALPISVYVGDVVSFYANIGRVGNTSMTIDVSVFSSRADGGVERHVKVATATKIGRASCRARRQTIVGTELSIHKKVDYIIEKHRRAH